jgi:hypothetical protein
MADFSAESSLEKTFWPADAHRPSRSEVLVEMAAEIAEMGVSEVPPC